jgi:hypothetical protein
MAQNKHKQLARLEGRRPPKSTKTDPRVRESETLSGNRPGERNRIGTRKTGQSPRYKGR